MKLLHTVPVGFKRILLMTDFSSISEKTLPYAAAVARHFKSTLYVGHVIPSDDYAHIARNDRDHVITKMKEDAERQLTALLSISYFSGIPHPVIIGHGQILDFLPSVIAENDIDLIVTGTHGKHGLEKLLSGSMAEEILRFERFPSWLSDHKSTSHLKPKFVSSASSAQPTFHQVPSAPSSTHSC
jgi:nucleotide-binding universal stress UspA family protein